MQFCQLQDTYSFTKARKLGLSVDAFYANAMRSCVKGRQSWREKADFQLDLRAEWNWWKNKRPYYNVWPAIEDILTGFDVSNVPFRSFLSAPERHIAVQFQKGRPDGIMCILLSVISAQQGIFPDSHAVTITEQSRPDDLRTKECPCATNLLVIPVGQEDRSMGECSDLPFPGKSEEKQKMREMVNAAIAILLMERSPELFEPTILPKDIRKYERADEAGKQIIEKRAVRAHAQRGYHLGRSLEMIPHYRRPHPALYWTGKGRSIAKIIFRAGAIVKRAALTQVPTGRLGAEIPPCADQTDSRKKERCN